MDPRCFSLQVVVLTNLRSFLLAINLTNSFAYLNRTIETLIAHLLEHFNHVLIGSLLLSMFDEIVLLRRIIHPLEVSLNLCWIGIRHGHDLLLHFKASVSTIKWTY